MRFLCDMGLSIFVAQALRARGHDAVHLREEGMQRAPDHAIFTKAASEGRAVLTFDLDFCRIAATSGATSPSVVTLRLKNERAERVIERLDAVLAEAGEIIEKGALVSVREGGFRVRELPIE